jgi:hypothetical protein
VGGTVVVRCIASTPGRIRICVEDTGEGLTPDKLTQLFQPFNRLGQESNTEEGTGIGLVVAKRLIELMGGVIGVESTVGKGSVFWIELNLTAEPQPVAGAAESTDVAQAQVQADASLRTLLYVEDNPANLMLVEDLIARRPDIRLLSARDGNRGIEMARASRWLRSVPMQCRENARCTSDSRWPGAPDDRRVVRAARQMAERTAREVPRRQP